MKLSEAMRLGIMTTPVVRGPIFDRDFVAERVCGACAIGTVAVALLGEAECFYRYRNGTEVQAVQELFESRWPWTRAVKHPLHELYLPPITTAIVDLFEYKGWTRDQIADWIETLETNLPAAHTETEMPIAVLA